MSKFKEVLRFFKNHGSLGYEEVVGYVLAFLPWFEANIGGQHFGICYSNFDILVGLGLHEVR